MRKTVKMALLGAAFGVSTAWAYLPPASFIVKTMVLKHGNSKGVRIRSNLTVFPAGESDGSGQVRFKMVHLYHSETGTLRSILSDDNGRPIYHFERSMISSALPVDVPAQALSTLLLDSRPRESIVKTDSVFLGRINKAVAWVIGERASSPDSPQLWVEKDTFLPLRWNGKLRMDFQSYRIYRDLYFPRLIQVSDETRMLFKEEVVDLKVAPAELGEFAKSISRGDPKAAGFTETGSSLPEALRETIQRYFEVQQ